MICSVHLLFAVRISSFLYPIYTDPSINVISMYGTCTRRGLDILGDGLRKSNVAYILSWGSVH